MAPLWVKNRHDRVPAPVELTRQDLLYDTGKEAAGWLALPQLPVYRILAAPQHGEHRNYRGPEHAEFVAPIRERPDISDLKCPPQSIDISKYTDASKTTGRVKSPNVSPMAEMGSIDPASATCAAGM